MRKLFGGKSSSGSKSKETADAVSSNIQAGHYGQFPQTFSIFFAGPSADKKSDFYSLGQSKDNLFQMFVIHKGTRKHQITLHTTTDIGSPPLALAGIEKLFSSTSVLTVPAPSGQASNVLILPMKDSGGITKEIFAFSATVGNGATVNFEWRRLDLQKKPVTRELVRLGTTQPETMAVWTEEANPQAEAKLGTLQFVGSGTTGELGESGVLVVVISLLRINQAYWEASIAADKMIQGAANVIRKSLSLGANVAF